MIRPAVWRAAAIVTAVALLALPAPAVAGAGGPAEPGNQVSSDGAVAGSLLITVEGPEAITRVNEVGGPRGLQRLADGVFRLRVPPGTEETAATALRRVPGVRAVEPDLRFDYFLTPDDEFYDQQWAHQQSETEPAWDSTTGSRQVRVALIDSGMDARHPDLTDNVFEPQVSVAEGQARTIGTRVDNDDCGIGHGTATGGVLGAVGNNETGIAGVAWEVSILDIALNDRQGGCASIATSAIVAGLDYAVNNPGGPVDVINLSFGGPADACPTAMQSTIDAARAHGAVVVAASGNTQQTLPGEPNVPAACNGVIAVGATGRSGGIAGYSTQNPYLDLVAPGGDSQVDGAAGLIATTGRDNRYIGQQGTSFSSPYVAGVIALIRTLRPELGPDEIERILKRSARDLGPSGRDDAYGCGLVSAAAAIGLAEAGDPVDDSACAPDPDFPVGNVIRVSTGEVPTQPIAQAVALSKFVFQTEGSARRAVLARADDFADALAGSALAWGVGPLLFTGSSGPLAEDTALELQRVLPRGSTVYLLGGGAALPPSLEDELRQLGYEPLRLFGPSREETAVEVAREVDRLGLQFFSGAILATRGNWVDAVAGGSIASYFGLPVLLTPANLLHPATAQMLSELSPDVLYVLGGTAAIDEETLREAEQAAGSSSVMRLGGADRVETAVSIAREMQRLLETDEGRRPAWAMAVNVRRSDGYAHILSATALTGATGSVFVPVEGESGDRLPEAAREYVTGLGAIGVVVGGSDLVTEAVADELGTLLQR